MDDKSPQISRKANRSRMHTPPAEPRPSVFRDTGTNTHLVCPVMGYEIILKAHTQVGLCLLETNANESRDNKDTEEQGALCSKVSFSSSQAQRVTLVKAWLSVSVLLACCHLRISSSFPLLNCLAASHPAPASFMPRAGGWF